MADYDSRVKQHMDYGVSGGNTLLRPGRASQPGKLFGNGKKKPS